MPVSENNEFRKNIKRADLKNNFLKKIILRLDYSGVIDIVETLKLLEADATFDKFVEVQEGFIDEFDFKLNDPESIATQASISPKELKAIKTFKYFDESKEMILEMNKLYTTLTVNSAKYIKFEEYCALFTQVLGKLKERNKFLSPLRFGVRKVNDCLLEVGANFADYFNELFFLDISKPLEAIGINSNQITTQLSDHSKVDEFFFNLLRIVNTGVLQTNEGKKEVYQVIVDLDGYTYDLDDLTRPSKRESLEEFETTSENINVALFQLFISTLSCNFLKKMMHESFKDSNIFGVNKNEI